MNMEQTSHKAYLSWFSELSRIPRGSYHEQQASDFLMTFARERGLDAKQDSAGNVLIRKPGTPGMENAPAVILQGHLDMVCAKEEGLKFDFSHDPIKILTDGDRMYADGTTLGADNGIAISYILALLDAKDIPHPPLEAVLTVQEEVGMGGASAFDVSQLTASSFINIDSGDEGIFCVSCAGGRRSLLHIPAETVPVRSLPDQHGFFFRRITLGGLPGGHSGLDIILERGNSNKLLARVLDGLSRSFEFHLVSIHGGSATNIIPMESSVTVFIRADDEALRKELDNWAAMFRHELRSADGEGLFITLDEAEADADVLTRECAERIIRSALLMPDGIISMDMNIADRNLVESSSNFALIRMENKEVIFHSQTRSSVTSKKEAIYHQIEAIGKLAGAETEYLGDYPAWEYNPDSQLQKLFKQTYNDLYGREARLEGIHAGLECGLFAEKFRTLGRNVDFIAFGPNITGAHSTKESLSLSSAENTWQLLKEVLNRLGTKNSSQV